jgi:hypothetical protein
MKEEIFLGASKINVLRVVNSQKCTFFDYFHLWLSTAVTGSLMLDSSTNDSKSLDSGWKILCPLAQFSPDHTFFLRLILTLRDAALF